jgi:hypothetical protein
MRSLPKPVALSDEEAPIPSVAAPPPAADAAGTKGGAPGVLPEVRALPQPGVPFVSAARAPRDLSGETIPTPRTFRVLNGGPVVYDGARFTINPGKIVTDVTHDVDLLKRQGIVLEELRS